MMKHLTIQYGNWQKKHHFLPEVVLPLMARSPHGGMTFSKVDSRPQRSWLSQAPIGTTTTGTLARLITPLVTLPA